MTRIVRSFFFLALLTAGAALAAKASPQSIPAQPRALPELKAIPSAGNSLDLTLTLGDNHLRIGADEVSLRTYNGSLIGPTLRVKPGDTLNVRLVNTLECPPGRDCRCKPGPALHHEHVAMERGLLGDQPKASGFNTTNLHTHGLHVSPSGNSDNVLMSVEPKCSFQFKFQIPANHPAGTFWYHPHVHGSTAVQVSSGAEGALIVEGGLDLVPEIRAAQDRVLVFQQIPYKCNFQDAKDWSCKPGQIGRVESFDQQFGPGTWQASGRFTTINGEIQPVITMQPGEVQRWRMIHGGVRETLQLGVVGSLGAAPLPGWLNEIALDGLATGEITPRTTVELEPGYRDDVLLKAPPSGGTYYLIDEKTPAEKSLQVVAEPRKVLAVIKVQGPFREMKLPVSSQLARFKPFKSITDDEVRGRKIQEVVFNIAGGQFTVNDKEFPGDTRVLELGKADEWHVSTKVANHPFHIHVNPFEVIETGPDGKERRYWKDTMLVKPGQPLVLRSRYETFDGAFVLHCHILDHEDRGMMQMVEIKK
jgi:FtsP/CotA-like multicopper oxidase with cupredoxin domain